MTGPEAMEAIAHKLSGVRNGNGFKVCCPAHDDHDPSLHVTIADDGATLLVKCHAGCEQGTVVAKLKEWGLWPNGHRRGAAHGSYGAEPSDESAHAGVTLVELCTAKNLAETPLRAAGVRDYTRDGVTSVVIPYYDVDGNELARRYRLALTGARFRWRPKDRPLLYGVWKLAEIREKRWVLLVEGESDVWTGWEHRIPVLGIPGKTQWRPEWAALLDGLDIYLWQEPDAEDLTLRVSRDIPQVRVMHAPEGMKDINVAHSQGADVTKMLAGLRDTAVLASEIAAEQRRASALELAERAKTVLEADNPLELIEASIRKLGYGGDLSAAIITYLALTTRVLAVQHGTMPAHLLLIGPPSAGKSYTLQVVLRLLPDDASSIIDTGSARVLIYDTDDLQHRVLVFSEADSLPAGEDNAASSAVRNLLQDNYLHYNTVVPDPLTGVPTVHDIEKPGPTVLVTTSTRPLGEQLMTRLFALDVPDDVKQVQAALNTAAQRELQDEAPQPDPALIAMQAYLQAGAPWDVAVPFAWQLATSMGNSLAGPRILRDYNRLLALIKAVCLLHHTHREIRAGRYQATVDDYAVVYDLVADMYSSSATGASPRLRQVVEAVADLRAGDGDRKPLERVSQAAIATHLKLKRAQVQRCVKTALIHGWLVNVEDSHSRVYDLKVGDPLPDEAGLPSPASVAVEWHAATSENGCNGVTPDTDTGQSTLHENGAARPEESARVREVRI